jgi:hypothetical protein
MSAAKSMVTGNGADWEAVSGGAEVSFGDNYFIGNTNSSGNPPLVSPR